MQVLLFDITCANVKCQCDKFGKLSLVNSFKSSSC